jgi:hypothetical protein
LELVSLVFTETEIYCLTPVTALHPSLRTEWFRNLALKSDKKACQDAVDKATMLFRHVATSYHENDPTPLDVIPASQPDSSSSNSGGFLASMLEVEVADVAPAISQKPDEKFADEVQHYLKFEGGRGKMSNPLAWWKVGNHPYLLR